MRWRKACRAAAGRRYITRVSNPRALNHWSSNSTTPRFPWSRSGLTLLTDGLANQGITTLEEKSLGAIAKGGDQPIVGLLGEGEAFPDQPGLYLMDTPTFSPESITSMIANCSSWISSI